MLSIDAGNITVMKKRDGKISLSTNKTKAAPTKKVGILSVSFEVWNGLF